MGREKIRAFYKWREDRGARTVVHSVHNFQATLDAPDKATCHWFLMLYGADGKPDPADPPADSDRLHDRPLRAGPRWRLLLTYRKFETWFEGGTPTTNPNLDDK